MYFDNLTGVTIIIVITLVLVTIMLTMHRASTDKKIHKLANQFSLIQHNENASTMCKHIHEKHPELCAGIDYTLKMKGDNVVIDEWNSHHPRPGS